VHPVKANYNRQARRATRCIRTRKASGRRLTISRRRLALTAGGHDLAGVAARIAAELELSPDMIDLLSPAPAGAFGAWQAPLAFYAAER
jgi:hypothetical protein